VADSYAFRVLRHIMSRMNCKKDFQDKLQNFEGRSGSEDENFKVSRAETETVGFPFAVATHLCCYLLLLLEYRYSALWFSRTCPRLAK
jgi:hypothetical protein